MREELRDDELERLLKSAAEDFSLPPSGGVWEQVSRSLHPLPAAGKRFPYRWLAAAAALLLLAGGFWVFRPRPQQTVPGHTLQQRDMAGAPAKNEAPAGNTDTAAAAHPEQDLTAAGGSRQPAAEEPATARPHRDLSAKTRPAGTVAAESPALPATATAKITPVTGATPAIPAAARQQENLIAAARPATPSLPYIEGGISPAWPATQNLTATSRVAPAPTQSPKQALLGQPSAETARRLLAFNEMAPAAETPEKKKARWEFFATPAVSYRTFSTAGRPDPTPAAADVTYAISGLPRMATTAPEEISKVYHHQNLGIHAGVHTLLPISGRWSLLTGVSLSKTGYDISANRTRPLSVQVTQSTGSMHTVSRRSAFSANSTGSLSEGEPITLHNNYFEAGVPVLLRWEMPLDRNGYSIGISSGVAVNYLLNRHINIFAPEMGRYFSDPSLVRPWNGTFMTNILFAFPLEGSMKLEAGPMVYYQLMSTYKKGYPVNEHPFATGLQLSLQW
ncbi:hypothetical protein [Compostibacter hankyongensis]|uniref:Outer membrane protein beta-barrel domain-containing protein n=1 Tax=Compostibacter hankyongensis TaxID=1007089 RepID=A0ABP8FE11_9BACT